MSLVRLWLNNNYHKQTKMLECLEFFRFRTKHATRERTQNWKQHRQARRRIDQADSACQRMAPRPSVQPSVYKTAAALHCWAIPIHALCKVLFRCEIFLDFATLALSFVCDKILSNHKLIRIKKFIS